ncbi:MAG: clan AA aspartic protease [Candidatus Edwardsbacteria bacterium]
MGETIARIKISSSTNRKSAELEVLVDTGATYTTISESILQNLGIETIDRVSIELADGRIIERDLGEAIIEVEGKKRTTPVIFGKENDATILGLVTLESCGLTVDPINRKLVPLPKIHQYYFL